ncbi:hypothetical protein D3C79_665470 [compost metagenome]
MKAEYFQSAGCGTRTSTDKSQVEEQQHGEAAPERVVPYRNAGGRNDRRHIDRHDAKSIPPRKVAVPAEPGPYRDPDKQEKAEKATHLMVLEQDAPMATQGRYIQGEGQASEDHDHYRHPMHSGLSPVAKRCIGRRKATRGDQRHRMIDGVERGHAGGPQGQCTECCQPQVDHQDHFCRDV